MSERHRFERGSDPHAAVGAFLLNALPVDERRIFEVHLRFCPDCQDEVARLQRVASLLPQLFALEPVADEVVAAEAQVVPEATDDVASDEDDFDSPPEIDVSLEPTVQTDASEEVEPEQPADVEEAADETDEHPPAPMAAGTISARLATLTHSAVAPVEEPVEREVDVASDDDVQADVVSEVEVQDDVLQAVTDAKDTDDSPDPADAPQVVATIDATEDEPARIGDVEPESITPPPESQPSAEEIAAAAVVAETGRRRRGRRTRRQQTHWNLQRPPGSPSPFGEVHIVRPKVPWLRWALAALCLTAVAAIVWGLYEAQKVSDLEDEIAFLESNSAAVESELTTLEAQTPAITFPLVSTTAGESGAAGTVFVAPADATAILSVTGMAPLPSDRTYQVWYVRPSGEAAAGPLFQVDEQGASVIAIAGDILDYAGIAITEEPRAGSTTPTTEVILQGVVSR